MPKSLQPHGLHHSRLPRPSLSPRVCSDFISIESVTLSNHLILCQPLLLLLSIFLSIGAFSNESALPIRCPEYWSFSFSNILPMNIQGCFPLGWTGLISLPSKGVSRVFSSSAIQKHQFFGTKPFLNSNFFSSSDSPEGIGLSHCLFLLALNLAFFIFQEMFLSYLGSWIYRCLVDNTPFLCFLLYTVGIDWVYYLFT